jgi:hypothetical protein
MLHAMHGEIYGGMEHSFETVHQPDTAGAGEKFWWRWDFLVASEGREPKNGCTSRACITPVQAKWEEKCALTGWEVIGGISMNHLFSNILQSKC